VTPGDYKVFAKTRDGRLSSAIMSVRVPDRGVDRLDLAMEQGMWVSAQMDGVPWSFDLRICRLGAMDSGQKHCFDELTIPYKEGHFEPTFIPTDNLSVMLTLPSGFEVESTRFFRPMPPLSKLPPPRVELGQDGLSRGDMVRIANPFVPDAVSCRDDPPIYVQGCFEFTFGTPIAVGGRAINRLGEPVPGAQIVLVPRPGPRERVRPEGTGYVTTVTDASGQLQTSALAGTYVVLAFEEIEPGAYYAQDFLSRFERSGIVAPVGVISAARPGGRSDDPPPWMTLQIPVISRDEMLNR
ncbi:MAG TPA: carboxypeptidase-like regulatory domain-containing protein, partial [Terriglobia bacterium]|nr:carboxypeptidase-like regulatory domain-containing protein [Terriglobia bacterium]